jgi:glycosyltransferase involved in cell wall biosynthesis
VRNQISVVLASKNARYSAVECLTALENQTVRPDQVIVVDNSTDGTIDVIKERFSSFTIIRAPGSALIPDLWGVGLDRSRGDVVAVSTTHFVPDHDWIEQISRAHEQPYSAVGGAIENNPSAGLLSWAVYFCRYSGYMPPFGEKVVHDLAADNASYKRCALDRCRTEGRSGFWESFVHAEMRRRGFELLLTPHIVVRQQRCFSFGAFLRQRFQHGVQFGTMRGRHFSPLRRAAFTVGFPLIPILLLWRITVRVVRRRRHVREYLLSFPILVVFVLSSSLGEVRGYISGRQRDGR